MQFTDPVSPRDRGYDDLEFDSNLEFDSKEIVMGLHWDPPEEGGTADAADLDALCVLFDGQGRELEVVYPGRLRNANGSVIHTGDSRTGASEWDDERIFVFLESLPETVAAIAFVVTSVTGCAFSEVRGACCHVSDRATEHAWVRIALTAIDGNAPHSVATLRRTPTGWEISADHQISEFRVGVEYYDK